MSLILLLLGCGGPERPGAPVTDSAGSDAADSGTTDSGTTDSGSTDSGTTDSGTSSADGPTLGVLDVELRDDPQVGPMIFFMLSVSDPQDDVNGGTLFVSLSGAAAFEGNFDISEEVGDDDVLLTGGALIFGIREIPLDGAYNYALQAEDAAGNVGPPLSGDVPPYAG